MSVSDPRNMLSDFDDVISAFEKYENGGFWVLKIVLDFGVYRESVLGPYSLEKATEVSDLWKKIFSFEGAEVAKIYTFQDLICKEKPKIPVSKENRWNPPDGMKLFCLVKKMIRVLPLDRSAEKSFEFQKFLAYTGEEGVDKLVPKTGNLMIFYNKKDAESYRRGHILLKFINESNGYSSLSKKWIIDKICGKNPKEKKPIMIPHYVETIGRECYPVELDTFKEFLEKNKKIGDVWRKFKKCIPSSKKTIASYKEKIYETLEIDFLINGVQSPNPVMKRFYIEKLTEEEVYNFILSNYGDSFSIGIYGIDRGKGELLVRLGDGDQTYRWTEFTKEKMVNGRMLSEFDILGGILFFAAKCIGVKKVFLHDEHSEICYCDDSDKSFFINPVRYIAGERSIYHKLQFKNRHQDEIDKIVEEYKYIELRDFVEDAGEYSLLTMEQLSKIFLDRVCAYTFLCQVLSNISGEIQNRIVDKYSLFESNIEEISLSDFRSLFA